jgi:hypothetical protein
MDATILQDPSTRKDVGRLSQLRGEQQSSLLLKWLMCDDVRRRALALEIVATGGKAAMPALLREALGRLRSTDLRPAKFG